MLSCKSIEHLSRTDREMQLAWFAQFTDDDAKFDDHYVPGLLVNYYKLAKDRSAHGHRRLILWLFKNDFQRLSTTTGLNEDDEYIDLDNM